MLLIMIAYVENDPAPAKALPHLTVRARAAGRLAPGLRAPQALRAVHSATIRAAFRASASFNGRD